LQTSQDKPSLEITSVNIMKQNVYGQHTTNSIVYLELQAEITLYHNQKFTYLDFGPCSFGVKLLNNPTWKVQSETYTCPMGLRSVNPGTYHILMYPTLIPKTNSTTPFPSSLTYVIYSYHYTGLQVQSNPYTVNYKSAT